ncbi:hypothetical protein MAA44156_03577 [Mycobacterium avium subsp. avium]|nr:hypothetical protein MAA44156_03577 [Mycobacterium avium subsp. avium]
MRKQSELLEPNGLFHTLEYKLLDELDERHPVFGRIKQDVPSEPC